MTFSLPFVLTLAATWVLPAVVIVFVYGRSITSSTHPGSKTMKTTVKGLRADIQGLDIDARKSGWRREDWEGPTAYVQARSVDSSHEVMVLTPYAEASVTVGLTEDAAEQRWCSLCLN